MDTVSIAMQIILHVGGITQTEIYIGPDYILQSSRIEQADENNDGVLPINPLTYLYIFTDDRVGLHQFRLGENKHWVTKIEPAEEKSWQSGETIEEQVITSDVLFMGCHCIQTLTTKKYDFQRLNPEKTSPYTYLNQIRCNQLPRSEEINASDFNRLKSHLPFYRPFNSNLYADYDLVLAEWMEITPVYTDKAVKYYSLEVKSIEVVSAPTEQINNLLAIPESKAGDIIDH